MDDVPAVERGRIRLLAGGAALALGLSAGILPRIGAGAAALPEVTVYKSPT
jgi:hypothetical protein